MLLCAEIQATTLLHTVGGGGLWPCPLAPQSPVSHPENDRIVCQCRAAQGRTRGMGPAKEGPLRFIPITSVTTAWSDKISKEPKGRRGLGGRQGCPDPAEASRTPTCRFQAFSAFLPS